MPSQPQHAISDNKMKHLDFNAELMALETPRLKYAEKKFKTGKKMHWVWPKLALVNVTFKGPELEILERHL